MLQLLPPLIISARLLPAVEVGGATLSLDPSTWTGYIDGIPGADVHVIEDFRPGARIHGQTDSGVVRGALAALLSFLAACAESRQYATRAGRDPMSGENSSLFPPDVGAWAEEYSDEIGMLSFELSEEGARARDRY